MEEIYREAARFYQTEENPSDQVETENLPVRISGGPGGLDSDSIV